MEQSDTIEKRSYWAVVAEATWDLEDRGLQAPSQSKEKGFGGCSVCIMSGMFVHWAFCDAFPTTRAYAWVKKI